MFYDECSNNSKIINVGKLGIVFDAVALFMVAGAANSLDCSPSLCRQAARCISNAQNVLIKARFVFRLFDSHR